MTYSTLGKWSGASILFMAVCMSGATQAQDANSDDGAMEEVIVTGSYIKRARQEDSASPIQTVGSEDLGDIGATSVSDLINSLTINTGAQVYSNPPDQAFSTGTTNINLRGLGVNSTLVMLNGRRQTLSPATTEVADSFVDLTLMVPVIAVDRVEILKDGASTLYGSDAVAGVVNFVTRSDFRGFEVDAGYTDFKYGGAEEYDVGAIFGAGDDNSQIMVAFNYLDRSSMVNASRRDVYRDNQDSWSGYGNFGKIIAFDVPPGPPAKLVEPMCSDGSAFDLFPENTRPKGGPFPDGACEISYGYFGDIVSAAEQTQLFAQASYDISEGVQVFAEGGFARNVTTATTVPSQPMLDPVFVSDTHPDAIALFGPDALLNMGSASGRGVLLHRPLGVGDPSNVDDKVYQGWRWQVGLRGDLPSGWSWEAAYTHSVNEATNSRRDVITENMQLALDGVGGPGGNLLFHPFFATQDQNTQEVYDYVLGRFGYSAETSQTVFDAHITGDLFEFGDNAVGFAFGFQHREDKIAYDYNELSEELAFNFFGGGSDFTGSDKVTAVFAEVLLPIMDNLEVQAAVRYEDFESSSSTDPKIALLWRPMDGLSLRGSYSTSFRTATAFQTKGQLIIPQSADDPITGEEVSFVRVMEADPNNPLTPQDSTAFNLGATWNAGGLEISLDYWNFDYSDYITPESDDVLLATDPSSPQILRPTPTSAPYRIITYFRNAGSVKTDGLDVRVSYDFDLGSLGQLKPFVEATQIFSYDMIDPLIGPIDGKGSSNDENFGFANVEFRANFGAYWNMGDHSANVIARHIGSYLDDNDDDREIDSWTKVDLQYSYQFGTLGGFAEQGPRLTFGVLNLFDQEAPTVRTSVGYDATTHDPRGRMIYGRIKQAF